MRRIILCAVLLCLVISLGNLYTQIPDYMSYQGMLTGSEGEPVADGMYDMHFKFFGESDPSTPLWEESQTVPVVDGIFNVIFGIVNSLELPFDEQYYLGIAIGEGAEMTPRTALTSSAYSFRAKSIDDGQVVKSINTLKDSVLLEAGENISITEDENKIIISASGGNGSGSITQITAGEGLTGGGTEGNVTLSVLNGGITTGKIADEAVTSSKLSESSVVGDKIADNQVVRSINSLTDDIFISAEGGATVTTRGDTLVVNAGSGGGESGVQGLQNTNSSLDIINPSGPTVTINVKNDGIRTQHILNEAVTGAKISLPLSLITNSTSATLADREIGVSGVSRTAEGSGVYGHGAGDGSLSSGVYGKSESGRGVYGLSDTGIGLFGRTNSASGYAGYFEGGRNYFEGNIGIGITDPVARLHVHNGNIRITNNFPALILDGTNLNKVISFRTNDQERGVIFYSDNIGLKAYVNDDANNNTWVLANNGRFGLGVNSPSEKLDVAGAVRLGTTGSTNAGTIRWTGTDFEGRKGSEWVSLTAQGGSVWNQSGNTIHYLAGNVGIGIDSPAYLAHIRGSTPSIMIENTSTTAAFLRFRRSNDGANDHFIALGSAGQMVMRVGGTDRMTLLNDGRVGIGTGTPETMFQIRNSESEIAYSLKASNSWTARIQQDASSNLTVWNGGQERMRIRANGNVGIGSDAPDYMLHVRSSTPSIMVENTGTSAAFLRFRRSGDGANTHYIALGSSGQMIMRVGGTDRITIQQEGNVGIGTGSPSNRLQVAGDVQVSGKLKRTSTGDNDMVPICYGQISSTGSILNGSGNFSVNKTGPGTYRVTISGESFSFSNYTVVVTATGSNPVITTWSSLGGNLMIYAYNTLGFNIDSNLSFVVYKP